jgi:hypothetical protein
MQDAIKARAELRTYRVELEKKRVEIKAPVLDRGRLIDAEAHRITVELLALEEPHRRAHQGRGEPQGRGAQGEGGGRAPARRDDHRAHQRIRPLRRPSSAGRRPTCAKRLEHLRGEPVTLGGRIQGDRRGCAGCAPSPRWSSCTPAPSPSRSSASRMRKARP